jgi:hypothetical protein
MAQVQEYIGKPSIFRRIKEAFAAALIFAWVPGRIARHYKAEGAKAEREELIRMLHTFVVETEKRDSSRAHAGRLRAFRAVLGVIRRRHNLIENARRDGPGDDVLLGEMSGEEYNAMAAKGGTVKVALKGTGK